MGLFKKKTTAKKPAAAVFVDFEHWAISLSRSFKMKPNIREWYKSLAERYELVDVYFFGDFSNPLLRQEIPRIREITTGIIETQNASAHHKKDFTDFIMLDHIYNHSFQNTVNAYILFTGDGHFSSVVSYLVHKRHKTVEVFGIEGGISNSLKNTADKTFAIPTGEEIAAERQRAILRNLKEIYDSAKSPRPTRQKTASAVATAFECEKEEIDRLIDALIEKGYLYQTKKYFRGGHFVKILAMNTALLKNDGVWDTL